LKQNILEEFHFFIVLGEETRISSNKKNKQKKGEKVGTKHKYFLWKIEA